MGFYGGVAIDEEQEQPISKLCAALRCTMRQIVA